ncbi:MAG: S-layer protein [Acidobacteria bacterium]|nr:MAG: S-layer protein [Acidobacteriota bacterium]
MFMMLPFDDSSFGGRLRFLSLLCVLVAVLSFSLVSAGEGLTPALSSYVGGAAGDMLRDVAVDAQGNFYLVGGTYSADFPVTAGAFDTTHNGNCDVWVAKYSSAGIRLWATFLGSPNYDRAYAVEVDSQGYVYVAGRSGQGFPTTAGSLQTGFGGDITPNSIYGQQDGFVTKLAPDGSRIAWSTYFGGTGRDFIRDIALDSGGNVFVAVSEVDQNHPHITAAAFQKSRKGAYDGVVGRLSADGSSVIFASYFGGSTADGYTPSIRTDVLGNAYYLTTSDANDIPVTASAYQRTRGGSHDMVLSKLSPTGALLFCTYFGGSGAEFSETHGLAVDGAGNAVIASTTMSANLPATSGAFQSIYGGSGGASTGSNTNYSGDGFIATISADGSSLLGCTYIGGSAGEGAEGVAVDGAGNVYVSGATHSTNFPVTSGAYRATLGGGADYFLVKLSPDLSRLIYGTYVGGSGTDYGRTLTVDAAGNGVIGGEVQSSNWPSLNAFDPSYGGQGDGGVFRFTAASSPAVPTEPTGLRVIDIK